MSKSVTFYNSEIIRFDIYIRKLKAKFSLKDCISYYKNKF